ncbi:MAG: hypothetical protein WBB45_18165 [Cyclobacteriaceae bacterium]
MYPFPKVSFSSYAKTGYYYLRTILFVCPDHEFEAFGITEPTPGNYAAQLLEPVMPGRLWNSVPQRVKVGRLKPKRQKVKS